ncbi:MAG: histidine kinase N-terminal 7TM domain-containing protein [Haloarculaceae archaeon]
MTVSVSPYVLTLAASAAVVAACAVTTWRRRREPGSTALAILFASIVVWTGGYALALVVREHALRMFLQRFVWLGTAAVPVAWFVFALEYTGYSDHVTRRSVALLSAPSVVMVALVFTNPAHHLVWTHSRFAVVHGVSLVPQSFGLGVLVFLLWAYTLVLAGAVFMLQLVFTAEHMFADQALAILLGALVPLGANVLSVLGMAPLPGLDLTPYAFAISGLATGYSFYHTDLLERVPATRRIGRNAVVRNMRDGVVVVDDGDVVVDVNPIAETQLGRARDALVGEPVDAAFGEPGFEVPAAEETVVWSPEGPLEYEITVSELTDPHDRRIGRVLVVRDITDRTNRRQQLQVLNRVLRHNFRNDLNVIDVCATQLTDRLDGEDAELAARIRMVARDLTETGTKAREIERIMSRQHVDPQPIDLPSLIQRLVDTLRHEYPEVEVELDLPDTLEIRSTGVLESVLQNVLENAVVHNDSAEPWLRVTVESDDSSGEVEIAVADNGPGIPAQERDVLVKGTETPLEHGSGLGLWLVNWGVSMLGGEVAFHDRADRESAADGPTGADGDPRGSVVALTVPRRQPVISGERSDRRRIDAD